MTALLWFVSAFGAVVLAMSSLLLFLQSRRGETRTEALARLQMGIPDEQDEAVGLTVVKINNPVQLYVYKLMWRAGYEVEPRTVLAWLAGAGLLALLLVWSEGILLGTATALFLLFVAHIFLQRRADRRKLQIVMQLPDFLEHVIRSLIAGNTLEESFATATRESPEPLRTLFLGVSRQVRLGAPIEESLEQVAVVQGLADVQVMAMSARINRRYGGSIRNMVKSIIQVIRQRETAVHELRALTVETRISALGLAAIPIGITLFVLYKNPAYYTAMWADPAGRFWLVAAFCWQAIGVLVLWRMMRSVSVA
jgi:tight adherence protein B